MSKRFFSSERKTRTPGKPTLPPLNSQSSYEPRFQEDYNLSIYPNFTESLTSSKKPYSAQKFFSTPKKQSEETPATLMRHKETKSFYGSMREVTPERCMDKSFKSVSKHIIWEMTERVESYQMRKHSIASTSKTIENTLEQFEHWKNCYSELLPLIKKHSGEMANVISKMNNQVSALFNDLLNIYKQEKHQCSEKMLWLKKQSNELEQKVLELQGASEELLKVKRLEDEQIKKEIEELFEYDDTDFQKLKRRALDYSSAGLPETAEFLKSLYDEMSKERDIPEYRIGDISAMNPEDLELGLRNNFKLIQKNTANKIFSLMMNRSTRQAVSTQTYNEFIEPEVYDELNKELESLKEIQIKTNSELERATNQVKQKSDLVSGAEKEKQFLREENQRIQKELDKSNQDAISYKRECDKLTSKQETLLKEKDSQTREIKRLQSKLETQQANQSKNPTTDSKPKEVPNLETNPKSPNITSQENTPKAKLSGKKSKQLLGNNTNPASQSERLPESNAHIEVIDTDRPKRNMRKIKTDQPNPSQKGLSPSASRETIKDSRRDTANEGNSESIRSSYRDSAKDSRPQSSSYEEESSSEEPSDTKKPKKQDHFKNRIDTAVTEPLSTVQETRHESSPQPVKKGSKKRTETSLKSPEHPKSPKQPKPPLVQPKTSYTNRKPENSTKPANSTKPTNTTKPTKATSHNKPSQQRLQQFREVSEESEEVSNHLEDYLDSSGRLISSPEEPKSFIRTREAAQVEMADRSVSTDKSTTISRGIQYNWESPHETSEKETEESCVYFMPFNPNNVFGLRGDSYFHTKGKIFQAQSRIPELSNSYIFQPPYKSDTQES